MTTENANFVHIYVVQHVAHEGTLDEDVKFIGGFSSRAKAEKVVENLKMQPGFLDFPDNFCIDAYRVDQGHWSDGFTRC